MACFAPGLHSLRGPLAVQGIQFMRKIVFAVAVASAALALSACKKDADDVAVVASDAVTDTAAMGSDAATAAVDAGAAVGAAAGSAAMAASTATTDTVKAAGDAAASAASEAATKM